MSDFFAVLELPAAYLWPSFPHTPDNDRNACGTPSGPSRRLGAVQMIFECSSGLCNFDPHAALATVRLVISYYMRHLNWRRYLRSYRLACPTQGLKRPDLGIFDRLSNAAHMQSIIIASKRGYSDCDYQDALESIFGEIPRWIDSLIRRMFRFEAKINFVSSWKHLHLSHFFLSPLLPSETHCLPFESSLPSTWPQLHSGNFLIHSYRQLCLNGKINH